MLTLNSPTISCNSNGSQFFITFGNCEWMNTKFEGFGRVIQGYDILYDLNMLKTSNQKPDRNVMVTSCGFEK